MKHPNFIEIMGRSKFILVLLLMTGLIFSYCKDDPQIWSKKSQELVAMEYIVSHSDQFSEFEKLIEATKMGALLSIRGPYTIFLPTNDAMLAYYKQKNVSSLEELSDASRKNLILNHIISNEITTGDIGLGSLRDTNAIGDYLVTEFQGSDIMINKYSKIIKCFEVLLTIQSG